MSTSPRLRAASRVELVVDRPEHEALHARDLAPILVERVERQLHARRERDELVGAGADRCLLVSLLADLLHVLLGHDPAGSGGAGVERQEVGPRRFELESDLVGVGCLDGGHPVLDLLVGRAAIPLEGEFHVIGRDLIAVVKLDAFAQNELVGEAVRGHGPRLGQARRHRLARHRLHHGVVQGIHHHERRDHARRLRRVEPRRRQRDVHAPGELTLRTGGVGCWAGRGDDCQCESDKRENVPARHVGAARKRSAARNRRRRRDAPG